MTCKLELTEKQPFYIPGSYIVGKLNCSLSKTQEVELIEVRFHGRETANYKVVHEVLFNSDRSICYTETVILKTRTVERGKNVYNFKIQIPNHIPSTYVSEYGDIRYELEGYLMVSQTKVDTSQVSIHIFSPIDVKSFSPELHKSARIAVEKDLLGICGGGGHVSTVLQLEKKVFLCGESINMNVLVDNSSGIRVRHLKACLTKSASCKLADGEYAESKETVITRKRFRAHVGKGENKSFQIALKIADDIKLPNLKYSEVFKIKYWLHVCVIFQSFWHRPLDICSNIYLGHLPHNF